MFPILQPLCGSLCPVYYAWLSGVDCRHSNAFSRLRGEWNTPPRYDRVLVPWPAFTRLCNYLLIPCRARREVGWIFIVWVCRLFAGQTAGDRRGRGDQQWRSKSFENCWGPVFLVCVGYKNISYSFRLKVSLYLVKILHFNRSFVCFLCCYLKWELIVDRIQKLNGKILKAKWEQGVGKIVAVVPWEFCGPALA